MDLEPSLGHTRHGRHEVPHVPRAGVAVRQGEDLPAVMRGVAGLVCRRAAAAGCEHEATEASGVTLAGALSAMGVEAAAVDPSSLEELRLGPDARHPTSRTLWIRFGGE